jgi:hypothetical protein
VSWYAKQMHPCRMLKDDVRVINNTADFERAVSAFLEWRLKRDEEVAAGRRPVEADADLAEAAA